MHTTLSQQDIDGSLTVLQNAFRQVRPLILARAGKDTHTNKADGSPVTETDVLVEKTIQAELAKQYPDMPIFGEEQGYGDDLPGSFWLLDPIDGTKSFLENTPAFTCMAALIQNGETIASIIYNISHDDMYVAQKDKGAYKNGARLQLAATPLPAIAHCKGRFVDALNTILAPQKVTCENGPEGGGFGFTLVADGKSAARFNLLSRGYTHDYAPGALLVREAGGAIIPIADDTYTYTSRSFIACHPGIAPLLQQHAQEIRALEVSLANKH